MRSVFFAVFICSVLILSELFIMAHKGTSSSSVDYQA